MDARERLIRRMLEVLGPDGVISEREQLCTYECDGLTSYKAIPSLVVVQAPLSLKQSVDV